MFNPGMIPPTTVRVPPRDGDLQQIHQRMKEIVQTHPGQIDERLRCLDHEWDIDRYYETTIGLISLAGVVLASQFSIWWLVLPAFGALSLLTHGLFGWSVFLLLFRGLGIRTATEIAYERYALKALRGDFQQLVAVVPAEDREAIATFEGEGGMVFGPAVAGASEAQVVHDALEAVQK
jgi:hypothetical protein